MNDDDKFCTFCPFKACMICKIENPAIEPPPLTLFEDNE